MAAPKKSPPLGLILGIGGVLVLLVLAGIFLLPGDAEAGEVFLVPAASAGPDPFSASPFAPPPDPALAQPAVDGAPPTLAPAGAAPQQAASGSKPGLYGGTNDKSSCDPSAMVAFLGANPDKAQAWVDALTADPAVRLKNGQPLTVAYIPHYVAELTPITLMNDVRVTNHGFKNGRANQIQSVLQKGSAVMVDAYGVPRVKCYCGNPLLPPAPSSVPPVYSGPRWPDFEPNEILVVTPPPEPIVVLIVVVPNDPDQLLEIPPGSGDPELEVYLVDGPPPSPESFDDGSEGPPTPPAGFTPRTPTPRQAAPPPTVAPMPPAPTWNDDPNDCSSNDCGDSAEDYQAIEDAYEAQGECYVTDLGTASGGYAVNCSECASQGGTYDCD